MNKARRNFGDEVLALKLQCLNWQLSHGINIVANNFARFAANDVKDRQVATGDSTRFARENLVTKLMSRRLKIVVNPKTKRNKDGWFEKDKHGQWTKICEGT